VTKVCLGILFALIISGCSFDGLFFPLDARPDDVIKSDMEVISLTTFDGVRIQHFLFKPAQKPKATIFSFQGSGSKVANWYKVIKPLIDDGYQIFMMDYRGFGKSQGESSHLAVAQDANNALTYLMNRDDVKNGQLLVLGQSYGGQLAINVAHNNSDIVDVLITEGTFTSFSDEAAYSTPWIISPLVKALLFDPYSAKELIADINIPKLIIHSSEDKVVPFSMAETLFDRAKGDKELWEVKGEHVTTLVDKPLAYVSKVNEMLLRSHNKTLLRTSL
jgi:uncharacterized protein